MFLKLKLLKFSRSFQILSKMAASLMQPELDPLFAKALRLLQSKEPQSVQQLSALVQEQRDKILGIVKKVFF